MALFIVPYFKGNIQVLVKAIVQMANSKTIYVDYIIKSLKQLYTCTMEFINFINSQALSSVQVQRGHY